MILPHVNENNIRSVPADIVDHLLRGVWWPQTSTSIEHAMDLNAIKQQVRLPCSSH